MSRHRAAAATATLLLSAVALPAEAGAPEALVLGHSITVETTRSGSLDVVLPGDARVSTAPDSRDVSIAGGGRLIGIWLTPRDEGTDQLTAYRLPAFAGGGQVVEGTRSTGTCEPTGPGPLPTGTQCTGGTREALLGEGRYRLTVLTDGAPVRITLHLRGLTRPAVTTAPTRLLRSRQQSLPVREQLDDRLVTFGAAADLERPVQTFVVAKATSAPGAVLQQASVCRRDGQQDALPLAYAPPCAGGQAGSVSYTSSAGTGGASAFGSSEETEHTGPVGLGGSFSSTRGVGFGQALGVWLATR